KVIFSFPLSFFPLSSFLPFLSPRLCLLVIEEFDELTIDAFSFSSDITSTNFFFPLSDDGNERDFDDAEFDDEISILPLLPFLLCLEVFFVDFFLDFCDDFLSTRLLSFGKVNAKLRLFDCLSSLSIP